MGNSKKRPSDPDRRVRRGDKCIQHRKNRRVERQLLEEIEASADWTRALAGDVELRLVAVE